MCRSGDVSNTTPVDEWYYTSNVHVAAVICRWNYCVIAPGNQLFLIRCAEHHHPATRPKSWYV